MGAPDFESRRLERQEESDPYGEPVTFALYGRDWRCVALLPLEAMEPVAEHATGDVVALLGALHGMIRAAVVDQRDWDRALLAEPLDSDTVAEIASWMGDIYGWRWKQTADQLEAAQRETAQEPVSNPDPGLKAKFIEARTAAIEGPVEAARRRRTHKMAITMSLGGEVVAPEDPEGYEDWENARAAVNTGMVEAWAD